MQVIESYGSGRPGFGGHHPLDPGDDDDASVLRAQAILKRLRRRDLYKFVEEFLVPHDQLKNDS